MKGLAVCRKAAAVVMLLLATMPLDSMAIPPQSLEWSAWLCRKIPPRQRFAPTGSEFAELVKAMDERQREIAIREQLFKGNIPNFLRQLKPVRLRHIDPDGPPISADIFVMPDYLAIGSDTDFLRIPMNLVTAAAIAERFGFVLPTTAMVDAIYTHSRYRFKPQTMLPGPRMRSTAYYVTHNRRIDSQRRHSGIELGALVAGHKKDIVITNRLNRHPNRIAIYGWHRREGKPIQPLSCVHGLRYADYSHGVRLISQSVLINGRPWSVSDVLKEPRLAPVLNSEGVLDNPFKNHCLVPVYK